MKIRYQPTSREAWRSFIPHSAELDTQIMTALEQETQGLICQDIEKRIGRSHQAVSGNLRHLVEKNLVKASGKFGITTSNRKAIKWIVNDGR